MEKAYRSIDFNDERKWKRNHPLDDVLQVGIKKSIGYICDSPEKELKILKKSFLKKDKFVFLEVAPSLDKRVPVLWVGDKVMMQNILDNQKDILMENDWPTKAKQVFQKIITDDVVHEENKILYHLIADLFNSWCLHCEPYILVKENGKFIYLSPRPYDPDEEVNFG
jgi:hypothetical protein